MSMFLNTLLVVYEYDIESIACCLWVCSWISCFTC